MPTLKARIGGVWTPVGYGMPPVFGATTAGIVRASGGGTSNFLRADGSWVPVSASIEPTSDQTFARLRLTATDDVTLASTLHALQIGPTAGNNVAFDGNEIMARNNGATYPLHLNADGGPVNLGGGYFVGKHIAHGSSPGIWRFGAGDTPALAYTLLNYSNDVYLNVDIAAGAGQLRHANAGRLQWDSTKVTSLVPLDVTGDITGSGSIYSGSGAWFRVRGSSSGIHWESYGGGWYMQDTTWLRAYNGKSIYTTGEIRGGNLTVETTSYALTNTGDTNTGVVLPGGDSIQFWCGGAHQMEIKPGYAFIPLIRIAATGDSNHRLNYSNETPPSSGVGSNGPVLQGYATSALRTLVNNRWAFLESGGSFFIHGSYLVFSSRESKTAITLLDPDACLDQVLRWQPVEYTPADEPDSGRRVDGFVAEDMHTVTPTLVNVTAHDAERPDWPNAVAYASATVRLAAAVQALARRLDALEAA